MVVWAYADDGEPEEAIRWPLGGKAIWADTDEEVGLARIGFEPTDVRVRTWPEFVRRYQVARDWRRYLERRAEPARWRLVIGHVPADRWVVVQVRSTDQQSWIEVPSWRDGIWDPPAEATPPEAFDADAAVAHVKSIQK